MFYWHIKIYGKAIFYTPLQLQFRVREEIIIKIKQILLMDFRKINEASHLTSQVVLCLIHIRWNVFSPPLLAALMLPSFSIWFLFEESGCPCGFISLNLLLSNYIQPENCTDQKYTVQTDHI